MIELIKGKKFDDNHSAMVINVKEFIPHSNADKLKCCKVGTYNIITSIDAEPGLYVYFQKESVINPNFLSFANLYRHAELNADNTKTGMFEDSGRIKTIKLRRELSEGFIIPAVVFENFITSVTNQSITLTEGTEFDTVQNGDKSFWVIKKWVVRRTQGTPGARIKVPARLFDRVIPEQFRFHYTTIVIKKCPAVITPDSVLNISEKTHGCVEASTLIETSEGIFTIKEIVDNKKQVLIKAFDTELNKIIWVPIDDYYMIPNDGDWYEIELEDGRKLTITGNNPVWLPELNCYRRVDELDGSEKLLIS